MNNFLEKIYVNTQKRVQKLQSIESLEALSAKVLKMQEPNNFLENFTQDALNVIAEIKFKSPSLGVLNNNFTDPLHVAKLYLQNGACAVSILTEPDYFNGSLLNLFRVREAFPLAKILMKDFIIDKYQILLARAYGADAILLIAGFLSKDKLTKLYKYAVELNLTPLIEVHDENELKLAENLKAKIIGINNRNLKTLNVDVNNCSQILKARSNVSKDTMFIAESGITKKSQLLKYKEEGFGGFLIGGYLMQQLNPGIALHNLLN